MTLTSVAVTSFHEVRVVSQEYVGRYLFASMSKYLTLDNHYHRHHRHQLISSSSTIKTSTNHPSIYQPVDHLSVCLSTLTNLPDQPIYLSTS